MFPSRFKDDPFFSAHGFPDRLNQFGADSEMAGALSSFDRSFGQMRQLMDNMTSGLDLQTSADGRSGHSYVQSSVYSYSRNANGQPDIYEAHHSTRHAPGGVREERKALRDSRKQFEKMAVGRHIGDRGHVIERSRNTNTDQFSQHQNLIGLQEEDVEAYQREWHEKTKDWGRADRHRGIGGGRTEHSQRHHALQYGPQQHRTSDNRKY